MSKKKNHFKTLLIFLFIVFIVLYFAKQNGYYDYTEYNKMKVTENAIKRFEEDVLEGKEIDPENYLETRYKDYSNNMSKLGLKTGQLIENIMTKGISGTVKIIEALFTN